MYRFNRPNFIVNDPISLPHRFSRPQDIEIIGLWTAVLAWGQRTTIIRNAERLIEWMGGTPYDFIMKHSENDLIPFESFVHRTFNGTDALYFIHFFRKWYSLHESLENAFIPDGDIPYSAEKGLSHFHRLFFNDEYAPIRTRKHIANPATGSSCKRLNMFLRWMVRKDDKGVDFGIWSAIDPADLICPLDIHVGRVARKLGLLQRKQDDWKSAVLLTEELRKFDPIDPVKYDLALFGLGIESRMA